MTKITFSLHHKVKFGEAIVVCGLPSELGNWKPQGALPLNYKNESWEGTVEIDISKIPAVDGKRLVKYKYITVTSKLDVLAWESGEDRVIAVEDWMKVASALDAVWISPPPATTIVQKSAAFVDAIRRRPGRDRNTRRAPVTKEAVPKFDKTLPASTTQVLFSVNALRTPSTAKVGIVGSCKALGSWSTNEVVWMYDGEYPNFSRIVSLSNGLDLEFPVQYKYVICRQDGSIVYEDGENRVIPFPSSNVIVCHDGEFRYPHTFTPAEWRGAGIVIPIFSLRTRNGLGVGEFLDVIPLVDWAKSAGIKLIQVLPVNDSTIHGMWWDTYPYSPASSTALHPMYLSLYDFEGLPAEITKKIEKYRDELNQKTQVEYDQVIKVKWEIIEQIYKLKKDATLKDAAFLEFFQENFKWLIPYAVFLGLRFKYKSPDHTQWPQYSQPTTKDIASLVLGGVKGLEGMDGLSFSKGGDGKWPAAILDISKHDENAILQYFVQYHLHRQLKRAATYANVNGIALKGDITIGVDTWSVDTWVSPHLFNMDCETGAPPDAFSEAGQNWGFPTYNWNEMAREDYYWWRQRLSRYAQYFQAVRLDHVLGFFRIWEIPKEQSLAMLGHFSPCIPVHRSELESCGLWDVKRLVEPYIRDYILMKGFHNNRGVVEEVKRVFLNQTSQDFFELKPDLKTMVAIRNKLVNGLPNDAVLLKGWKDNNLEELMAVFAVIVSNVCFTRDKHDPEGSFHARLGCAKCTTYQDLEEWQKRHVDRLHLSYFFHRQDTEWSVSVKPKLSMMKNTSNMMICGEDLGMIPDCVAGVLESEAILGVRLPRLPKGKDLFDHPRDFPYLVVSSPSCHDLPTMRCWWDNDSENAAAYLHTILGRPGDVPKYNADIAEQVVKQLANARNMFVVYPIAELMAMVPNLVNYDSWLEEINRPSVKKWNWRFRLQTSLEDLIDKHIDFTNKVYDILLKSGRINE